MTTTGISLGRLLGLHFVSPSTPRSPSPRFPGPRASGSIVAYPWAGWDVEDPDDGTPQVPFSS
ncbi:hypothetical protein [Paenarthrobacter nicotinovorans]|uniref:hypothetical protein n=1 Tax=Paenarthrobacter nicotinovorans TaxID=29320 RepID=UPI00047A2D62|nr:hypothetical protein [Paenarthrobacter nicotinovorans]